MSGPTFRFNPGSPVAIDRGCLCPDTDNNDGDGAIPGHYWIDSACPLHHDVYDQAVRAAPATEAEQQQA